MIISRALRVRQTAARGHYFLLIGFAYDTGFVSRSCFVRVFTKAYDRNPTDNQLGSSLE